MCSVVHLYLASSLIMYTWGMGARSKLYLLQEAREGVCDEGQLVQMPNRQQFKTRNILKFRESMISRIFNDAGRAQEA